MSLADLRDSSTIDPRFIHETIDNAIEQFPYARYTRAISRAENPASAGAGRNSRRGVRVSWNQTRCDRSAHPARWRCSRIECAMRGSLATAWIPVLLTLVSALALAQPAPAARRGSVATTGAVAGDCPNEAAHSEVGALARSVRDATAALAAGATPEECARVLRQRDRLRGIENLSRELGCRDGSPCAVRLVLDQVAAEQGLPAELLYAVAWTESNWTHWRSDGRPVVSRGGDLGLLQLNPVAWGDRHDMEQVREDLLYNARAGAKVVKWAYNLARRRGYRGNDLLRSTYAIFNGGPGSHDRPWKVSRFSAHDRNFLRYLQGRPWTAAVRSCSTS